MFFLHFLHPTLFPSPIPLPSNSLTPRAIPTTPPLYYLTHNYGTTIATYSSIGAPNATTVSTSSNTLITITGTLTLGVATSTIASTSSSGYPRSTKNSQPCNGHVDFCDRRFSNISMVVAHNSPFAVPHNAASNQDVHVLTQLNDGVRGCTINKGLLHASIAY
jgi:hypothetical protein